MYVLIQKHNKRQLHCYFAERGGFAQLAQWEREVVGFLEEKLPLTSLNNLLAVCPF
jgi:hypothetical protein